MIIREQIFISPGDLYKPDFFYLKQLKMPVSVKYQNNNNVIKNNSIYENLGSPLSITQLDCTHQQEDQVGKNQAGNILCLELCKLQNVPSADDSQTCNPQANNALYVNLKEKSLQDHLPDSGQGLDADQTQPMVTELSQDLITNNGHQ